MFLHSNLAETIPNGAANRWQRHSEAGNEAGSAIRIQLDYTKSSLNVSQIFEWRCHPSYPASEWILSNSNAKQLR